MSLNLLKLNLFHNNISQNKILQLKTELKSVSTGKVRKRLPKNRPEALEREAERITSAIQIPKVLEELP